VRRGDEELVSGAVEIACVNMASLRPAAIPETLYRQLEALA
jgi:acyl-CoA thioester hydrolase